MNTSSLPDLQGRVQYVLDGGALIHRIPWIRGSTSILIVSEQNLEMQLSYLMDIYKIYDTSKESQRTNRTNFNIY